METGGDLADAARARADVDAIRRRVVNVVGHALRTPVTTIAGMTAALASATDEETRRTLIEGLARNARRMERLLDELLVAAGVSTVLPVDEPSAISIHDAVQEAWAAAGGPGVVAISGPDVTVVARASSFDRIVSALFDNALKYGEGDVAVRVEPAASGISIEVESTGAAPSDDELGHAFELLYRGEHAVTSAPGLGLGLAVGRELARADGGELTLVRRGNAVVAVLELPG